MLDYIKELLSEGHSEDTICHLLKMEGKTTEESYKLIAQTFKALEVDYIHSR